MKRGLVRNSRYSPGNLDRESLEALFVGRQPIMTDVVDTITSSIGTGKSGPFNLLVGPRGCGKTHFVSLAYHRIREAVDRNGYTAKLEVAFLNEEEWGVASYLDFLVRVLRSLSTASNGLEHKIETIYEKFSADPKGAETYAEELIASYVGEKTLWLICENLVDLFDGLGESGQKRLRAFIQQTGFWTVLATSPALFSALTKQDHPFTDFFKIQELSRINYETAHELLVKKATHDGQPELAEFLTTPIGRARIRAIHHLAAGNHRAYVILYDFLDRESLDDLVAPFLHMVDDLTPYYQDRMRQLPPAQRKVIEFLCQHSEPEPVKSIAAACLMSQQTTAKQVWELWQAGFVSRIPAGRQTFCELAEPLMRICIEIKDNRTEHFRLFVEFLRHWFTSRELESRLSLLEGNEHSRAVDNLHFKEALRCARLEARQPFVAALREEGRRCIQHNDYQGLTAIYERVVAEGGSPSDYHYYVYALRKSGVADRAATIANEAVAKFPNEKTVHFDLADTLYRQDNYVDALLSIDHAISIDPTDESFHCLRATLLIDLERYEEAIVEAEKALLLDPEHFHSYEQVIEALSRLGMVSEAERKVDELISLSPNHAGALTVAGCFYYSQERYDDALRFLDDSLQKRPHSTHARYIRGLTHFERDNHPSAVADFRSVIAADKNHIGAHCRLSDSLMKVGDFYGAINISERLIELDPQHGHAYVVLGSAHAKLNQFKQMTAAFESMLINQVEESDLINAAEVAMREKSLGLASRVLAKAVEIAPNDLRALQKQAVCLLKSGEIEAAWKTGEVASARGLPSLTIFARVARAEAKIAPAALVLSKLFSACKRDASLAPTNTFTYSIASVLLTSVVSFGPSQLIDGVRRLREILSESRDPLPLIGKVLTDFVVSLRPNLKGSIEQWEATTRDLDAELGDIAECKIPIAMLTAAVSFSKTGDGKHLLRLPLEQRQLLEEQLSLVGNIFPEKQPGQTHH